MISTVEIKHTQANLPQSLTRLFNVVQPPLGSYSWSITGGREASYKLKDYKGITKRKFKRNYNAFNRFNQHYFTNLRATLNPSFYRL